MPYIYFSAAEVDTLQRICGLALPTAPSPTDAELQAVESRLVRQTMKAHRVVREIVFEGTEAELREQLARSQPDGPKAPGQVQITLRTITSSLPEMETA